MGVRMCASALALILAGFTIRKCAGSCELPEQPANGQYRLGGCNPPSCQVKPGTQVDNALLFYSCSPGFQLSGSDKVFCDQRWLSPFPSCISHSVQKCPPFMSSMHDIQCKYNNRDVRCDRPMLQGTKAIVNCKKFYESPNMSTSEITCNSSGSWSAPLLTCTPECGTFDFNESVDDNDIAKNVPWYAAIMKKDSRGSWQFACSATILSQRTLVSVAQCVWKELDKKVLSEDNFGAIVGKYEQGPRESKNDNIQQFLVQKIFLREKFTGYASRFEEDISVFILKDDIIMNEVTRPICVDLENKYAPYLVPGKVGIIGSWGEPVGNTYKQKTISLPMVDFDECLKNIPAEYHPYLTYDKFCAGVIKKKTICIQDSGTGFATRFKDGKWYLSGIASVGVSPRGRETCETNFYKAFTRVSLFYNFIQKYLVNSSNNTELIEILSSSANSCKENEFKCASSECINRLRVCDGTRHCSDGSDETYQECHLLKCPSSAFQCRYGACIGKAYVCNGRTECDDDSDEDSFLCRRNSVNNNTSCSYPPSNGCILPNKPENGNYQFIGCKENSELVPDSLVPTGVLLNYSCDAGFLLSGPSLLACYDGWSSQPPSCNPVLCEPLKDLTRDIKCILNRDDVDCVSKSSKPGTRASVACKRDFESIPGLQTYDIICGADGKWNRELQSCVPKCGLPNAHGIQLIAHGERAKLAQFPWHVGFYATLENGSVVPSCGGSIVSPRLIISAAHCFWQNGEIIFHHFKVVAGKYYYNWENNTKYVQHLQIQNVFIPREYKDLVGNYANDIALVVLKYGIHINEAVRPVCVDYERNYLRYFSPVGTVGQVIGWGLTEKQTFNDVLYVASLPYVDTDECERNSPTQFHGLITNDKFCAGNINKTTVCQGDSGGGYTVKFRDGRYYLVGIVSLGPNEKCGKFSYVAFTNVFEHVDYIRNYVYKY